MERVGNGVSTRKVAQVTVEICGTEFSKSTVSDLCKTAGPIMTAWNARPLQDERYPFLIVDAMVREVREEGRVRARGALMEIGIRIPGSPWLDIGG